MSETDKKTAAVRICDICGIINACDLDATPRRIKDMQLQDHTVTLCTHEEAIYAWKKFSGRCDHKKYVQELRAQIAQHTKKP